MFNTRVWRSFSTVVFRKQLSWDKEVADKEEVKRENLS